MLLCVITVGQLVASMGMQWFAIANLGADIQTDALVAGMTLPLLCITLGVESFTFVLTPMLAIQPESVRSSHAWQLLILVGIVSAAASITLAFAAPLLLPFLVPGFGAEVQALTLTLTRIQLGAVVGAGWYAVLAGLCQVRGQFLRAPLAALGCMGAAWAILAWRLRHDGILLAAWMQVAAYVGPPLLLLPAAGRPVVTRWWPSELWELWRRLRPVFLAASYCRSGFVVDRCLASFAGPGSLVILDLGQRVQGAAVRVMNEALVTPTVPMLARIAAAHQWDSLKAVYRHQRWRVAVAAIGLAAGIVIISTAAHQWLALIAPSPPIADTIRRLVPVLGCLSGIAATASLSHSLTTAFYAMGDTVTPSKVGAAMYTVALAAKVVGAVLGGLQGIALAITLCHVCNWLALEYAWARACAPALSRQSA
jgi:peptidoglycan biosynthesis protein MviN/MurJ (putative lipid II flippase)